ncbi:MAG: DUF3575 domain-containing protein [Flavobacteriales bacterium]|nr:DUF3575 domain-containing protein [Flavobacteriales bacterium]MCC6937616.1 DUF3575 domain-containing protein [Flavobacteriales bacterium]
MKRILLLGALCMGAAIGHAQDATGLLGEVFSVKRIVKTNLVGYAFLSVNANYEQKTGPNTSVGLLAGYKLPSTIHVEAIGNLDGENQTYSGDVEPKGIFVNPYFRYYTAQTFKGFYMEAFLRYFNYSYLVPYDYDKNGGTIHANLDGTASAFGGGLALGAQFNLAPRVYLDINAGFGVATGSAHLETSDPNLELADYQSIKRNIEKYQDRADVQVFLLGDILKDPTAVADDIHAEADFKNKIFPIVRGGICIGYAF